MDSDSCSMAGIDSEPQPGPAVEEDCTVCGLRVSGFQTLVRHMRQVHSVGPEVKKPNLKCSFDENCQFLCGSSETLRNHLKLAHNFKFEKKTLNFPSKEDFNKWKVEEEALAKTRYVAYTGTMNMNSERIVYLKCHSSGSVRPENFERKGAKPENGYMQCRPTCPSTIRVLELADGTIEAMYYPDHLGHSLDEESVRYVKLRAVERQEILGELAKGEAAGKMVKDARKQKGNRLSRYHFLQRRDVYNLKKNGIYLEKDIEHDGKMVHAWIKGLNLGAEDKSPIVYYSPLNRYKDYTMIIIHEVQKEAFMHAYDGNIVYVKTKKGKPNIDLNMTAVTIVSAEGDAFPIAFCISHKTEYATLYTLYNTIYRQFGTFKPKFFVSDNLCQSQLAWRNVMGESENPMTCIFDLESIWGQKLAQHRVPMGKQKNAANRLKSLLYEMDRETFAEELEIMLNEWSEDGTMKLFTSFFQKQYVRKCEEWAACFRTHTNPLVTIDVHLEPINGILDAIYVESYTGISGSLNYLMAYIRDSCLLRVIEWDENYRLEKMYTTERNHAEGAEIRTVTTNGSEWIFSQDGFDYVVKRIVSNCRQDCGIFCNECGACVHQYICLCKDYVIGFNLCKHIHAARMIMAHTEVQEAQERMAQEELLEEIERMEMMEREKEDTKPKKEKETNGGKVEKRKKDKVELPVISFKTSAVSKAKALLSDLQKSSLTELEYRTIAHLLTMLQNRVQELPDKDDVQF